MLAVATEWWLRPVISAARVGLYARWYEGNCLRYWNELTTSPTSHLTSATENAAHRRHALRTFFAARSGSARCATPLRPCRGKSTQVRHAPPTSLRHRSPETRQRHEIRRDRDAVI